MNSGFMLLLALVVVVAAAVAPFVLKQIGHNMPITAANLPSRKEDYLRTATERFWIADGWASRPYQQA